MAFENDYPNRQTIDRESGTYLKFKQGVNQPNVYEFSFHFEDQQIDFYAEETPEYDANNQVTSQHWTFFQLDIPTHLEDRKSEIVEMISEAMEVYGSHYNNEQYRSVTAVFKPPQIP